MKLYMSLMFGILACALGLKAGYGEGTIEGDSGALENILAAYQEAETHFPDGYLRAKVVTENALGPGVIEATVEAHWTENASRIEAQVSDRRQGRNDFEAVVVQRGLERLQYSLPPKQALFDKFPTDQAVSYLICLPRHCWYGRDPALVRPWTWYLDARSAEHQPERISEAVVLEDGRIRFGQKVERDGKTLATKEAIFDPSVGGMCTSFSSRTDKRLTSGTAGWEMHEQARPYPSFMEWRIEDVGGGIQSCRLDILELRTDVRPADALFSFDLSHLPKGTFVIDRRVQPSKNYKVGAEPRP